MVLGPALFVQRHALVRTAGHLTKPGGPDHCLLQSFPARLGLERTHVPPGHRPCPGLPEHPDPVAGMKWKESEITLWAGADQLDPHHPKFPNVDPQLYNLDAVAYESVVLACFHPPRAAQQPMFPAQNPKAQRGAAGIQPRWVSLASTDRRPFLGVTEQDGIGAGATCSPPAGAVWSWATNSISM